MFRKVLFEMKHILNSSTSPAIDTLCIIPNYSYITILRSEHLKQFILSLISILEFINENIGEALFVFLMDLWIFLKKFTWFKEQILKIHCVIFFKSGLVLH